MPALYELTDELRAVENMIADAEGEISEAEIMAMTDIKQDFEKKAESIAKMIKNFEGERDAYKNEGQRLMQKANTVGNKIDWLKKYVKGNMIASGIDKIKGEILSLTLSRVKPSVNIINEALIPKEFKEKVIEIKIDKNAILEKFKAKVFVPGVEINDNNKALRIR